MLEKRLLTIIAVIKKMQLKLKKNNISIEELTKLVENLKEYDNSENEQMFGELVENINSLKTLIDDNREELYLTSVSYQDKIKELTTSLETSLSGIKDSLKDYITIENINKIENELTNKIKAIKIEPQKEIEIGKVHTLDAGMEAKVEVTKTKDSYKLDFYIPRGVSGRGQPGKGVPEGGTTNQVLVKNSNDDYDTKWSSAGSTSQIQSDWNQTDNTEVDYIKNKPTIPTKTSDLTNDSNFVVDASYVHTDNNFTDALETKLNGIEANANNYVLPTASTTVLGGVKIDGSTINITDGIISAVTGGSGDVTGPAGATSDDIVLFDGATGKLIKDSGKKLSEYEPVLPATPTSPEIKYLNGNRQWTEVITGSGGYAANVYLTNLTSTTDGDYLQLSYTNDSSSTEKTITTNNNEVLGQVYLFDLPIGVTTIDAGNWNFTTYNKVSSTAGSLQLKYEVFKYAVDTTETTLFSVYSPIISNTSYTGQTTQTTQPIITLLATDKLGLRIYAKNTVSASVTLSYTIGDGNTSWVNTPLALRHNQLRDKNGEDVYQHIDISDKNNLIVNNDYLQSSGRITGGVLSAHSPANGTLDVSEMYGLIRTTDTLNSSLIPFTMTAKSGITLTDNTLNYIYYDYTTATCASTTNRTTIHNFDQFTVGRAYRTGNTVEVVNSGTNIYNSYRRIHNRLVKKYGFDWVSGATLSESDTRKLAVTDGIWYIGNTEIDTNGFDTNVSGSFYTYYLTGSTWTKTGSVTQLGNTQYNDVSSGLVSLGVAKYANYWVYICPQGDLYVVYGQAQYNSLAEAQAVLTPSTIPDYVNSNCRMIARISFKQAGTNFASISNTLVRPIMMTSVSNHNNLGGLQGGTIDEYYHLTNAQNTIATQSATSARDGYLTSTDWSTFNNKQPAGSYEVTTNKENSTIDTSTTKYPTVNLLKTGLDTKQATLVSGTNIKTINSNSLLGSGDLTISEFTDEKAQDAVGTILTDTATIDFTYTDASNQITADVKDASITYTKIQNVSATDKLLGRSTAGSGSVEEISCTAAGRALLDDATASDQRTTLGLGTSALNDNSGWITGTGTWSYSSATVISINADMTTTIGVGDRIKLTQTTVKYFIVTAVGSYSGGNTPITVYGGTDYTVVNASITSPYYSHIKNPFGFPLSPNKWTITYSDSAERTQLNPSQNTWYNINSASITLQTGAWLTSWGATMRAIKTSTTGIDVFCTLSTANNSESDGDFTASAALDAASGTLTTKTTAFKQKVLDITTPTTYYFNTKTSWPSVSQINNQYLVIKAICAYL